MLHDLTTSTFRPDRTLPPQLQAACAETIERLEQRVMLAASDGEVVARGDFNGDDRQDIIVYRRNAGRNGGAQLRVFVGTNDGFRRVSTVQVGIVRDVAVGDFNNDGSLDLVVAQKRNEEALKKAAKGLRLRGVAEDGGGANGGVDDGGANNGGGGNSGGGVNDGGGANAGGGNNGGGGGNAGGGNNSGGGGNPGSGAEDDNGVCGDNGSSNTGGLRTLAVGDDGGSDQEPVDGDGDRDDEDPDDGDGGPNNGPGDDDDDAGQDDDGDDDDNDQDGNGIDDDEEVEGNRPGGSGRRRRGPVNFDTDFGFPRGGRGGDSGDGTNDGTNRGNTGKGLRGNASSLTILMGNGNGTFDAARTVASNVFGVSRIRVGDFNDDGNTDLRVRARNINADGEPIKGGGRTTITFFGEGDGTFRRAKNA